MRFERVVLMRTWPAYSIRDRGENLNESPDIWLQSYPDAHHRFNAWQTEGVHICRIIQTCVPIRQTTGSQRNGRIEMLKFNGMRLPIDVILVCVRWYAAYPLSYRHLQEMMKERGVVVDHSSINRWAIKFLPLLEKAFRKYKRPVGRG